MHYNKKKGSRNWHQISDTISKLTFDHFTFIMQQFMWASNKMFLYVGNTYYNNVRTHVFPF